MLLPHRRIDVWWTCAAHTRIAQRKRTTVCCHRNSMPGGFANNEGHSGLDISFNHECLWVLSPSKFPKLSYHLRFALTSLLRTLASHLFGSGTDRELRHFDTIVCPVRLVWVSRCMSRMISSISAYATRPANILILVMFQQRLVFTSGWSRHVHMAARCATHCNARIAKCCYP